MPFGITLRGRSHAVAIALFATLSAPPARAAILSLDVRVATSSDDAEQKGGSTSVSLTSSDLELVTDGSAQTVGMRFAGLAIPRGVTITDAWLQFQVDEATIDPASLTLRAQAADNAPTFTTAANDVAGRAVGAASLSWSPAPWPAVAAVGPDQRVTGLAPLIQEVVNRPGWASGNALALLVTGSGVRTAEAFDGTAAGAPLLHVAYDLPGTSLPPSVTLLGPGDHAMFSLGQAIPFSATASDPEDGSVTASLTWTSSRDGALGSGGSLVRSNLSAGIHTITATAHDAGGQTASQTLSLQVVSGSHVLVGAGDIAECGTDHDADTAALLDAVYGTVVTLGDNAYSNGTPSEFTSCYGPTWGRHKARTRPALGNHEYNTPGAAGYFGYFGAAAGTAPDGYYSYDVDAWHVVVLNSECANVTGGCARTSPQGQWLAADLAAHPNVCTLAILHRPRGSDTLELWQLLYEAGADVVLAGHQHNYERYAPQKPDGSADPSFGIRQFVVGTGGTGLSPLDTPSATRVIGNDTSYGVLKLTLYPSSYDWQFLPAAGSTFTDSGTGACVDTGHVNAAPVVTLTAPAEGAAFRVNTAISFSATALDPEQGDLSASIRWSSDRNGFLGVGATLVTSALSSGTHRITATATDSIGGVGAATRTILVYVPGIGTTQHRVAGSADDAEERVSDGRVTLTSNDLELTFDKRDQVVGLRFPAASIPRGSTILDAYVQFQVDEVSTGATALTVQVEASDSAAPFGATTRNVSLRPRTPGSVAWSPPDWPTVGAAGTAQRTPNLASLLQPVIDRPGWAPGQALGVIVVGASKAPLLVIQYDAP
jgi:hypothetical protein